MAGLEKVSDESYQGYFVDLYVRCVNFAAINMYECFGYSVYQRVREYYSNLSLGFGVRDEEAGSGTCSFHLCLNVWTGSLTETRGRHAETTVARSYATICMSEWEGCHRVRERGVIAYVVWKSVVNTATIDIVLSSLTTCVRTDRLGE